MNHCLFDESNPSAAKCLEKATAPAGHSGPLIARCQPGRRANSVIGVEHIGIWSAERDSLVALRDRPGVPGPRKAALQQQLDDVETVIARIEK